MLLHELFADADLLNEFPGSSILMTVGRKVVAFMPDSRLPNITLEMVGSQVGRFILKVRAMDSLAKNGSTVFLDALMTCCPDEKEFLLSCKGIIVLIFCAKLPQET
ncbi:hypothetical protein NC652_025449 [Populus alba x Populus x berolinensis]|nr:hypothetical protein NC652_025449 [Populus alba x Populus x berolinensis]